MHDNVLRSIICPKLCVYSRASGKFLLCERVGEADLNGLYSFPGGKVETIDASIVSGLHREIDEELGSEFSYDILTERCILVEFVRKDGAHMTLPHFFANSSQESPISLNTSEYSSYLWAGLDEMSELALIENVPQICAMHPSIMDDLS